MANENNEVTKNDGMSRLLYWEVWNFMCFTHAKFEFNDKNIINLVGYNNSGKSAALRALEVNLYDRFPKSQLSFIQSKEDSNGNLTVSDHFRVITVWSDGIVILRDKYANGQSLYEMWKGDTCLFSTKQNGVLTRVSDVPQCIQDYLCLVKFEDSYLNSRSCFEKQFLVQTSGGENYAALNTVLKSEELSLAGALVNADRNKLSSDISVAETEFNVKMKQYKDCMEVTDDLVSSLRSRDKLLDVSEEKLTSLGSLLELSGKISEIPELPAVSPVSFDDLQLLDVVLSCQGSISRLGDIPKLNEVDSSRLDLLLSLMDISKHLEGIVTYPQIAIVDDTQLVDLLNTCKSMQSLQENEEELIHISERLSKLSDESKKLDSQLQEFGIRTVRCSNCGALVEVGGADNGQKCCSV